MGGTSVEREISLQTGEGVLRALESLEYRATPLDYDSKTADALARLQPAAVFNALHGGSGEDGTVQALLEWMALPYQGSGVRACAAAMDKWMTKALLGIENLPAPRGVRLSAQQARSFNVASEFGFPCVVKPKAEGSAVGVSIVHEQSQWADAVQCAVICEGDVVVEEYVEGRECTVAILGDEALPIVEITPHDGFYSYRAKYTPGGSTHTVPAQLDEPLAKSIARDALALHRALGCRDYSRIDVIIDAFGNPKFLECNTLPGLTPLSLFPDAAKAAGIPYDGLVERLLLCALSRAKT